MPATEDDWLVKKLQDVLDKLLEEYNKRATLKLAHDHGAFVMEDEWVHLVVVPTERHSGAYEYVKQLAAIEKQLREQTGHSQVLLVPAISD